MTHAQNALRVSAYYKPREIANKARKPADSTAAANINVESKKVLD